MMIEQSLVPRNSFDYLTGLWVVVGLDGIYFMVIAVSIVVSLLSAGEF